MRALKLKLFQETACYKKPFAFKISETYPLPPYSTVSGMLHKLIEAKEYIPFKISIQGTYESIINNYQTTYFYKDKDITSMPMNGHLLLNVNLIVHVMAEEDILQKIYDNFCELDEFLSLGRKEDLLRVDEVKFVNIIEYLVDYDGEDDDTLSEFRLKYPVYICKDKLPCELRGINYRLNNYYYDINDEFRHWNKVNALYVEKDNTIDKGKIMLDDDNEKDIVFLN